MARAIAVVALVVVCAAAAVMAGRVKEVPPGMYLVAKQQEAATPACNLAADMTFIVLRFNTYSGFDIMEKGFVKPSHEVREMKVEEMPKYRWADPGKTLCNGKDRIIYLGMGVGPKDKPIADHYLVLQTYGGGKYAFLYQSFSSSSHADDEGNTYNLKAYLNTIMPYLVGRKDLGADDYKPFPPILKELPATCDDVAAALQTMVDTINANQLKALYNKWFAPPGDKISVSGGIKLFGKVLREKEYFQLYKFRESDPSPKLDTKSSFLETAIHHGIQHRVKSPAALMHLKQHKQLKQKRVAKH